MALGLSQTGWLTRRTCAAGFQDPNAAQSSLEHHMWKAVHTHQAVSKLLDPDLLGW